MDVLAFPNVHQFSTSQARLATSLQLEDQPWAYARVTPPIRLGARKDLIDKNRD